MSASSPASARNPVDTMDQAWDWVSLNWSEILIASAAGLVIYLLLGC